MRFLCGRLRYGLLACCLWGALAAVVWQWFFIVRWHRPTRATSSDISSSWILDDLKRGLMASTASNTTVIRGQGSPSSSLLQPKRIQLPGHDVSPISWVVFYHIYIPTHSANRTAKALSIVREQLDQIRTSYAAQQQLQSHNNTLLMYTTIGRRILPEVMQSMCQPDLRCVNAQALGSGFEDKTLRQVHAYCTGQAPYQNVTVTYLHNKGSHHSRGGANDLWRQHMTRAVTSRACYNAVNTDDTTVCDACGLLFQAIPSLHFPGNFWTARCDYIVKLLHPTSEFGSKLASTLSIMDTYVDHGLLTRQLYNDTADWTTGRGRYADEQWIASHHAIRPCDVSTTPDLRYWKSSPRPDADFMLHMVPRRSLLEKHWQIQPQPNSLVLKNPPQRLTDYHLLPGLLMRWWFLYKSFPTSDSWVWKHFPDGDIWRDRISAASMKSITANQTAFWQELVSSKASMNESKDPSAVQHESAPWTVFYHVYLPTDRSVKHIIEEQLSTLQQSYAARSVNQPLKVHYSLVGNSKASHSNVEPLEDQVADVCQRYDKLDCQLGQHATQGNEDLTLASMHQYCRDNPNQSVVYFHSKGSFHESPENENWRRHLLAAATSSDCLESMQFNKSDVNGQCNVCGLQFYPVWAFFFPGNFYVSRCSYIRQLLPPSDYSSGLSEAVKQMLAMKKQDLFRTELYSPTREGNLGSGRYAWEQWVGSHPSLRPCDLSLTANFRHWVQAQSHSDWQLSLAPRHDIWAPWYRIQTGKREAVMANPSKRIRDYFLLAGVLFKSIQLYNATPPLNSWIYKWFPDGEIWQHGVQKHGTGVVQVLTEAYQGDVNFTDSL